MKMSRPVVHVLRTGLIKYAHGLNLQKLITSSYNCKIDYTNATSNNNINSDDANAAAAFRNILILTEHQPVYTIGIRTKDYSIDDEAYLRSMGAEFYRTNRGGLITFHGHGQLVAYPILHLKQFTPSIRWYVCHLEKTIIDVCSQYALNAKTTPDTGVWIDERKICAMGVHCKRYITSHGLALNCNIDLSWFDHIVPCGLIGKQVTSLTNELNRNVTVVEATSTFLSSFKRTFNCDLIDLTDDECNKFLLASNAILEN